MQSILIVDDLESIHEMLEAVITPIGYNTVFATDGESALQKLNEAKYDVVLTDINMKPMDGIALLGEIKKIDPEAVVIMMSGFANINNATQALKLGAFDYLTKPFKVDQLMASITRATLERKKRQESGSDSEDELATVLVGQSNAAKKLNERVDKHANTRSNVLLFGEPGTQKGPIAYQIHHRSDSSAQPFVTIDAKKLDEHELFSKLFDENGNPSETVAGAEGGTLFLANIEHVSPKNQAQLSDLIRDLKGTCRVISSSSRDLEKMVEAGEFEDALFFRIASNVLDVPPVRERSEDLSAIVISILAAEDQAAIQVSEQAAALMQAYRWPGNFPELKEVLKAAIDSVGDDKTIQPDHLPEKLTDTSTWPNLEQFLEEQSNLYKEKVLKACQGDRQRAAEILACAEGEL